MVGPRGVYVHGRAGPSDGFWARYDQQSGELERIEPDYLVWQYCAGAYGCSGRFGLVTWGNHFYRLVVAHDRPAGALQRRIFATVRGVEESFEPQGVAAPASPDGAGPGRAPVPLPPELADPPPSAGNAPARMTIDDLIETLSPLNIRLAAALQAAADMKPQDFPAEQRRQVADHLLPPVMANDDPTRDAAQRALSLWHTPESEPPLLGKLHDANHTVQVYAIEALGVCKDPATIPQVVTLLEDLPNPVTGFLLNFGPATAEPILLQRLQESKSGVTRTKIIDALALIGRPDSVPVLQSILDQHPDREMAEHLHEALEMIRKRS